MKRPDDQFTIYIAKGMLLLVILCSVSLSLYGIHLLYMNRGKDFVLKRSKWLVHEVIGSNMAVTSAILSTVVVIPTLSAHTPSDLINHTESLLCWFIITLFLNVKYFLFLLRGKQRHHALRAEWQKLINPKETQRRLERVWYVRNEYQFNTLTSTYFYFGTFHLMLFILCELSYIFTNHIHGVDQMDFTLFLILKLVESFLFLIPFSLMLLIGKLTPHLDDPHFIHWERRSTLKLVAFLSILLLTSNWMNSIASKRSRFGHPIIISLVFAILRVVMLFGIVVTSTFALIYRNNRDDSQLISHGQTSSKRSRVPSDSLTNGITLNMVLSNGEALDLLMRHLEREYSMEVLLSYIELDQFQKYVTNTADEFLKNNLVEPTRSFSMSTTTATVDDGLRVQSERAASPPKLDQKEPRVRARSEPGMRYSDLRNIGDLGSLNVMRTLSGVPTSEILLAMSSISTSRGISLDQRTMHDIKKKAHLLYNKYIKCGSPFEVNVSCYTRSVLRNVLDDKDKLMKDEDVGLVDLVQMFDEVKRDMKQLLSGPFARMKTGTDWAKLTALLGSKTKDTALRIPITDFKTPEV